MVPRFAILRKAGATAKKSAAMTMAPMKAPTAGIARKVLSTDRVTTRSSPDVAAAGALLIASPGAAGGILRDGVDVGGVDERRAGRDRSATADGVAVRVVQPEG